MISKSLGVLSTLLVFLLLCVSSVRSQDLQDFGIEASLPDGWSTSESYTASLPAFGVYQATSESGGYFWVQVTEYTEATAMESPLADSVLIDGLQMAPLTGSDTIAGFVDGFNVVKSGLNSYFFVSRDDDRLFRFRIGIEYDKANYENEAVAQANAVLSDIVKSIAFID